MNKEQQEQKQFLEQQLEWCKNQDRILEEIEMKLHEMKEIAQSAFDHTLTAIETKQLMIQLNKLREEVSALDEQRYSFIH